MDGVKNLVIIYEDADRTMKFLHQLSSAPFFDRLEINTIDAGVEHAVIATSTFEGGEDVCVFSRCSGSYTTRMHNKSPAIIESMLFTAEQSAKCTVFNGSQAFRIEMNKMLANLYISGSEFQNWCTQKFQQIPLAIPTTVAVTELNPKLIKHTLKTRNFAGDVYFKGLVGGGSQSVRKLHNSNHSNNEKHIMKVCQEMKKSTNSDEDIVLIQNEGPSWKADVQYRFELINKRVYYVVRVDKKEDTSTNDGKVKNLCMCEIEDDDKDVDLILYRNAEEFSKDEGLQNGPIGALQSAKNIYSSLEKFAVENELHVVAIEGTIAESRLFAFDINTNSNYNENLEKKYDIEPAAWKVVSSMFET